MGILARDIAWLPRNTGCGYAIDYVKSSSRLGILGENTAQERITCWRSLFPHCLSATVFCVILPSHAEDMFQRCLLTAFFTCKGWMDTSLKQLHIDETNQRDKLSADQHRTVRGELEYEPNIPSEWAEMSV